MTSSRIAHRGLRISLLCSRNPGPRFTGSFGLPHSAFAPLAFTALTESVSIAHCLVGIIAGVIGGILGILTVGLRMGAWRQKVDDGLAALGDKIQGQWESIARHEQMLRDGARRFDELPALASGVHALTDQLEATTSIFKDLVTKDRCNDRHSALERICDERHRSQKVTGSGRRVPG